MQKPFLGEGWEVRCCLHEMKGEVEAAQPPQCLSSVGRAGAACQPLAADRILMQKRILLPQFDGAAAGAEGCCHPSQDPYWERDTGMLCHRPSGCMPCPASPSSSVLVCPCVTPKMLAPHTACNVAATWHNFHQWCGARGCHAHSHSCGMP